MNKIKIRDFIRLFFCLSLFILVHPSFNVLYNVNGGG